VHPLALYRRLAELGQIRQAPSNELRAWLACMDKWGEELGNKVKLEVSHAIDRVEDPLTNRATT
jgi:hypothetical protein